MASADEMIVLIIALLASQVMHSHTREEIKSPPSLINDWKEGRGDFGERTLMKATRRRRPSREDNVECRLQGKR